MESMSNAPYILPGARKGLRMGDKTVVDLMIEDGLKDPYGRIHMGTLGDLCAKTFGFSREEQDAYAHKSYEKAIKAQKEGLFDGEITPISLAAKNGETLLKDDEEPSRYMPEKFSKLKPAFGPEGSITAANSSKLSDGAAALVLASEEMIALHSLKPKARIIASLTFAAEPKWFTTAPVQAISGVLAKASLSVSEIDCFEINEAFSVVPMLAIKELSIPADIVNIFGGAIALGHPIGCSGARALVTLLNALEHMQGRFGCVSLCIGGGEAVAMIVERLS
jgi:acetyl-CoA C-acetyltransferase